MILLHNNLLNQTWFPKPTRIFASTWFVFVCFQSSHHGETPHSFFFLFLCWAWRWKCKGSSVPLSLPPPVGPVDGEEVFQPTSLIRCHLFISLLRHPFSCYSQGGKATLRFYSPLSRLPLRLRRKWQRVAANPSCLWMTQELRRGRGRLARSGVHLPGMPFA